MSESVEFVIIMSMRYMDPALMGPAHDWAESTPRVRCQARTGCVYFTSHPIAA